MTLLSIIYHNIVFEKYILNIFVIYIIIIIIFKKI